MLPEAPPIPRAPCEGADPGHRSSAEASAFCFAVAGVACTAIAAALLGGGLFNSGPSRDPAVDTNDGAWIKVSILDGQAGADQMTNELQDAGINGEVQLLPATPQFVGHWMGVREINAPSAQCQSSPPPGLSCANAPLLDAGEADVNGDGTPDPIGRRGQAGRCTARVLCRSGPAGRRTATGRPASGPIVTS